MILLCNQLFEGPLDLEAPGAEVGKAGVYAIICDCTKDRARRMVDCSPSDSLGEALTDPKNHKLWKGAYPGRLSAYVWYLPDRQRSGAGGQLAQEIRERYHPWCNRRSQRKSGPA